MMENLDAKIDKILEDNWINYPKSVQILKSLEMLLRFPKSNRMQNLLIMGESNNGKTTIAKRFLEKNPPYLEVHQEPVTNHVYEIVVRPVIMVQCPHIPHEKSLYYGILEQLNLPYRKTTRAEYLKQIVIKAFVEMKVKVLILDEIHHILSGSPAKQREFLNLIKYISNEAKISIVALGTNEASYALKAEKQLDTRFDKLIIPRWKNDDDFLKLLATIERIIDLEKESDLTEPALSNEIHSLSYGILGEVIKIVKKAAILSLEAGENKITLKTIKELNYTSPFENAPTSFY